MTTGYSFKISPYSIGQIQLDGLKIPYYPSTKNPYYPSTLTSKMCIGRDVLGNIYNISVNVGSSARPIVSDT